MACSKKDIRQSELQSPGSQVKRTNASPVGDVVGKIVVGYQGWFAAIGDGSPINIWWHWADPNNQTPTTGSIRIKSWPDVREYSTTYATSLPNLGNGQQARLFSNYNDQTVNTHFLWMQQNNIDCAALQRFNPTGGEGPIRDVVTAKVKTAAETYGRKFYIMYDVTGWTNMQSEIKTDWTNKMSAYTSSSAYAKQNGKPVVCIWGFGFNDPGRPFTAAQCLDVVNWFKAQGCYVIGGVPREWRTGVDGSRPGFIGVYHAFNMLSPWLIGAVGNVGDADNIYNNHMVSDQADCNANGIDYQPCVLPGDLQEHQRVHGDLMWRMFYNAVRVGAQSIYISMYDEYNEGNQIAKTAESAAFKPAGTNFVTLDEDGTACSADYYLRLTGDGGRMLKGQIALTATRPTQPIVGGGGTVPIGQVVTLKGSNNQYVSSENGTQAMNCNRPAVGGWEQFTVVNAGSGKVALLNSGKYVSSENGTQAINCNRTAIGPWEQFDWVNNGDGTISLRGNNGRYLSGENGSQAMTCNRTTIGATEKFRVNQ
ncbi:hypothetical protein GCM10023149_49480 [Mucilaginibacter gynuensis]|uniref:Lectin n=2 Tax=Mucilaginibacter gynuensis TaxID=1302236 RepID=A0ABP8HGG8_9SPHI